jgi:UDP-2,4-diacetamido-2,4,6-trideoxy-beta-L-altropyranose hydrolase
MKIIIRTDASVQIGSGHVMRCLTLAEELKSRGCQIEFICQKQAGDLIELIQTRYQYPVHKIDFDEDLHTKDPDQHTEHWINDANKVEAILLESKEVVDLLIVDKYAIDIQWEKAIKRCVKKIMVIDDLANRRHDCDILLDQNFYLKQNRYKGLLPKKCRQLIGLDYLLLRKEFIEAHRNLSRTRKEIRKILVFFGASDISNITGKTLAAIKELKDKNLYVDVVTGAGNRHREELLKTISEMPGTNLHIQIENMAMLMASADLFIGAGGSVTWERCFLNLPGIVVTLADNQVQAAKDQEKKGIIYYLGNSTDVYQIDILNAIQFSINNPQVFETISKKSRNLIDGEGTYKVAEILINGDNKLI